MRLIWLLLLVPYAGPLRRWFGFHSLTGACGTWLPASSTRAQEAAASRSNGTPAPFRPVITKERPRFC